MAELFTNILEEGLRAGTASMKVRDAREWLREKADETVVRNPQRVIQSSSQLVSKIRPGFLYFFQYDPKMKQELPYYDRFPVVFPFRITTESFYGINLHYLPYEYRAKLMDNLYGLVNNNRYDETTKLRLTHAILESTTRFRFYKPCIKQYLNNHVKSRFVFVPSEQWDVALFLPLERFMKATKQKVHNDSRKMLRNQQKR